MGAPQPPTGPAQPPPALPPVGRGGRMGGGTARAGYDDYSANAAPIGGFRGGSGTGPFSQGSPASSAAGSGRGGFGAGSRGAPRGGAGMGPFEPRAMNAPNGRGGMPPAFPRGAGGGGGGGSAYGGSSSRSDRSSRGGGRGGRPVSGLPGRGGFSGSAGGRDFSGSSKKGGFTTPFEAPKGPRSLGKKEAKKERKWGSKEPAASTTSGAGEAKRTLTDFRISSLAIPEIEWEWKTEQVLEAVQTLVDAATTADATDDSETVAAPPSSPTKDMSLDTIAPPSDDPTTDPPKKKLSKRQKKAEAAAKRAATLAAQTVDTAEDKPVGDNGAEGSVADGEGSSEPPSGPVTEQKKKDGKHKRDEDEDEGVVVADATAPAKKVKADTGEPVVLENVDVGMNEAAVKQEAENSGSTVATETTRAPSVKIPTGPAAGVKPPPSAPVNRETSRLRIYFSSPVAAASTYLIHRPVTPAEHDKKPPTGPAADRAAVPIEPDLKAQDDVATAGEPQGEDDPDLDGEDIDGVDVDGEPVPVEADAEENEDGASSEDEVSESLLAKPSAEVKEIEKEQESAEVKTEEEKQDEPVAPTLDGENASYPPDPYAQISQPPLDDSTSNAGAPPSTTDFSQSRDVSLAPEPTVLPPEPSADRISISYARNTRRMVLDAEVVRKVKIYRSEGRIELDIDIKPATLGSDESVTLDEFRICKGVLIEALDPEADDYIVIDRTSLEAAWRASESAPSAAAEGEGDKATQDKPSAVDALLPPLHQLIAASDETGGSLQVIPGYNKDSITIVAHLDKSNPLTEARWVKTGEVEQWIISLGLASGQDVKKDQLSEWRGKIVVADPDPPPTIQHALDSWATTSVVADLAERRKFVATHMSDIDNVLEILLRLTRGGGTAYTTPTGTTQAPAVGVLAATLSAPYPDSQTQVSLAVLAMFRLSVQTAEQAGLDTKEVHRQVSEIVRGVPYTLQFKALDGMFKEWRAAKK